MPYGFPSGDDLMDEVTRESLSFSNSNTTSIHTALQNVLMPNELQEITHFGISLQRGSPRSIDHFVSTNPQYANIAKSFIAHKLLQSESEHLDNVFRTRKFILTGDNEYELINIPNALRYLFHKMSYGVEFEEEYEKHNFITFNYERSLEHYIYNMFKYGQQKNRSEARQEIQKLEDEKLIHVYGKLGKYEADEIEQYRHKQNSPVPTDRITQAMRSLSFIDRENEEKKQELQDRLATHFSKTDRVVVLGFGYEISNIRLLRDSYAQSISKKSNSSEVSSAIQNKWYGSAMGKLFEERKEINTYLPMWDEVSHKNPAFHQRGRPDQNDLQFLKEKVSFLHPKKS